MDFIHSFWNYILISSPYLLLGFFIAGLLRSFVSIEAVTKSLGKNNISSVIKASMIGVPLPLCSCSVIPTAVGLKKSGASNGATSSFLISTPESGVDSIALTYGIMDLPMAIFRPVAAFVSGFFAGVLQMIFNNKEIPLEGEAPICCSSKKEEVKVEKPSCCCSGKPPRKSIFQKLKEGFSFAFIDLFNDMAFWLFIGLVSGALIDFFVPANWLEGASGFTGRLIILGIGIPLYVCASSSTPIAAALVMKGLSPGSALLFMLVGPATNISNIAVLQKYLGKKGVAINIFSIAFVAMIFSYLVDWFYQAWNIPVIFKIVEHHDHFAHSPWALASAIIFSIFLARGLGQQVWDKYLKPKKKSCCH